MSFDYIIGGFVTQGCRGSFERLITFTLLDYSSWEDCI